MQVINLCKGDTVESVSNFLIRSRFRVNAHILDLLSRKQMPGISRPPDILGKSLWSSRYIPDKSLQVEC